MPDIDKIKSQFVSRGFKDISKNDIPASLLWNPTLIFLKDGYTYFVLFKTNNSILPGYLNRIALIPKGKFIPLIIFGQRPKKNDEENILSSGVSIGYFIKGKLSRLEIKKKIPQTIFRKQLKNKLTVIDIFLSSKQDIAERKFVEERIEYLRRANYYPFNPPHLIEYDKFELKDLYRHINAKMKICEWIIIILEDEYSKVVRYEINRAIREFDHNNIFMFVKLTSTCQKVWQKELNKIKKLETESIKFMPYSDLSELEVFLSRAIKDRINDICKKLGIERFQ